jgi:hypothetical protein
MPQTGLRGPYNLDNATIDAIVTRTSPGAYALGKVDDNIFYVSYVGRSDDDINRRLKDWVGKYPKFKFEYYDSPKAAFEKECNLYHDFGEKENWIITTTPKDQMGPIGNALDVVYSDDLDNHNK